MDQFGRLWIKGLPVEHLLIKGQEILGHMDRSEVVTDILMALLPVVFFYMFQCIYQL